jgi:transposase-like protein
VCADGVYLQAHNTATALNKVALLVQVDMKADLREICGSSTRAAAEGAIDVFDDKYGANYEKAVACLTKDREALLALFDFPAEHAAGFEVFSARRLNSFARERALGRQSLERSAFP